MANTMEKAILKLKLAGAVKDAAIGAEQVLYTPAEGEAVTVADKIAAMVTAIEALPTDTDVATAVANAGHAKFEVAASVPTAANAKDNILYLVMNSETEHYDIYAKVGSEVVRLDDTTVDLSGKADASHTHAQSDITGLADALNGKAAASHTHAQSDITGLSDALAGKADANHTHTVDSALSSTSENPVQNKVINEAINALGKVYVSATEPAGLKDGDIWIQIVE